MIIGVLQFRLEIPWAQSLKDKRSVVSGLKTRITQRHGAGVAEVGSLDSHHEASLAAVIVGNDAKELSRRIDRIVDFVRADDRAELISQRRDMVHGSDLPERPVVDEREIDEIVRTMVSSALGVPAARGGAGDPPDADEA